MKILSGKGIVFLAILLCGFCLGYRMCDAKSDAALLRDETIEDAIVTVAVVSAKPLPRIETIVLPVGWYEAPTNEARCYGVAETNMPDFDAGYWQNVPLSRAVIGGLLRATFFILLCVPWDYAVVYRRETAQQKGRVSS